MAVIGHGRPIRGADLFCGSGGFSTGLVRACERLFPGRGLDLVAVNHWQVAIDTHQANHPNVRHFCADLEHLKPRDAVPGGVLDILLAAPSCTYHSRARGGAGALVQPIIAPYYGGGSGRTAKSVVEPLPAQGTKDRFSIATPFLTQYHAPKHEHDHRIAAIDEPIGTQTTENRFGVAQPFLVPNFGERAGQEPRTHDIADPAPTIAASGHIQLARAVIAPCTHHDASNRARGDDEPLPAITGANRGELAVARPFVSLCTHGNESNQGRAIDEPIPTVTTAKGGEMTLATPAITDTYYIDILYRMLHWTELARATSFEDGDWSYQFTGTSTEITKQIGNAVPVRTGAALCAAILEGA